MPKRSAFSISITVALDTSIPTSITVVAISTSAAPETKAAIASCFSRGRMPAVQQHQAEVGELALGQPHQLAAGGAQFLAGRGRRARALRRAPPSSIRGHTTYAWRPARSSSRSCS